MNGSNTVQTVIERFTSHDIRLTPQRINVYKFLLENRVHPTVDMVYSALKSENPSLSKTTIYNIIEVLTEAGLVKILRINDGDVRLDGEISHHAHFYCKECGEIKDIFMDEISIPKTLTGYQFDEFDVSAAGICVTCVEKK